MEGEQDVSLETELRKVDWASQGHTAEQEIMKKKHNPHQSDWKPTGVSLPWLPLF